MDIDILKNHNKIMFNFIKDISNILPWTLSQQEDKNRALEIIKICEVKEWT